VVYIILSDKTKVLIEALEKYTFLFTGFISTSEFLYGINDKSLNDKVTFEKDEDILLPDITYQVDED
jgi:hypothetical protein